MMLLEVFVFSLVIGLLVLWMGRYVFARMKILDNPSLYGFEREAVPYSMGVWSVLLFVGLGVWFLTFSWQLVWLMVGVVGLGGVCFWDDLKKIHFSIRLLVQFLMACLVVYGGAEILSMTNPFSFEVVELGGLSFVFSVIWIMALTNLMNFLDGVSGLSSGVSGVGFFVLFAMSVLPGVHGTDQSMVQVLSLILTVLALLNFLFEFPSPKFLMGDSGTMFFGFMLGVLSMLNGGKLATAALVLLIPLFDGVWVIGRRILSKKSPFLGDDKHLHHRLERIGFSKQMILFGYMAVSLIFGMIAIFVWNTLFKTVSLVLLFSTLSIIGYLIWIKETR